MTLSCSPRALLIASPKARPFLGLGWGLACPLLFSLLMRSCQSFNSRFLEIVKCPGRAAASVLAPTPYNPFIPEPLALCSGMGPRGVAWPSLGSVTDQISGVCSIFVGGHLSGLNTSCTGCHSVISRLVI